MLLKYKYHIRLFYKNKYNNIRVYSSLWRIQAIAKNLEILEKSYQKEGPSPSFGEE